MSAEAPQTRPEIPAIVGPTGVGKTSVGVAVALALGGEIVSADSRQVYRGMDVGTAKPTSEERALARHHLIDIVEPSEIYDAARFAADAESTIARLLGAGITPLVVGGTGFYLTSLFEGLFEGPGRNDEMRDALRRRLAEEGAPALHHELAEADPKTASRLHPNDGSRIIRALEVLRSSGMPLSEWHTGDRREPAYTARYFALTMRRKALYRRIDERVDRMMAAGLLDEERALLASGRLTPDSPAASAVGYRELLPVAIGESDDVESAVEAIKRNTRRYAKRQLTWFSSLPVVTWLDVGELGAEGAAEGIVAAWKGRI
jgi:tRNA dimethylallyltransferase